RLLLLSLFREATAWFALTPDKRSDLLLRISHFIFRLPDTRPSRLLPTEWSAILAAWMAGRSTAAMATEEEIKTSSDNPNDLCLFVEDTCGYLLPWGLNSILTYLSMVAAELGQVAPEVCAYFAGMVKYGVAHPVAVCLVPFVDHDRELAMAAAALCPYGF